MGKKTNFKQLKNINHIQYSNIQCSICHNLIKKGDMVHQISPICVGNNWFETNKNWLFAPELLVCDNCLNQGITHDPREYRKVF